jgi:hypothetical protein
MEVEFILRISIYGRVGKKAIPLLGSKRDEPTGFNKSIELNSIVVKRLLEKLRLLKRAYKCHLRDRHNLFWVLLLCCWEPKFSSRTTQAEEINSDGYQG